MLWMLWISGLNCVFVFDSSEKVLSDYVFAVLFSGFWTQVLYHKRHSLFGLRWNGNLFPAFFDLLARSYLLVRFVERINGSFFHRSNLFSFGKLGCASNLLFSGDFLFNFLTGLLGFEKIFRWRKGLFSFDLLDSFIRSFLLVLDNFFLFEVSSRIQILIVWSISFGGWLNIV